MIRLSSATPVSAVLRFCRLRTKSPAPNSSRKLSATCAVTRPLRRNSDPLPPASEPTVSLSVVHGSGRLERSAGTRPNTIPVVSVRTSVKPRMRASGHGAMRSGAPSVGMYASRPRVSAIESSTPARPPKNDSTRLSTSSCRTSCRLDAPSDRRTAISRWRMKPRAISRLATFAQAMSSTRPTMHMRTTSGVEKSLRRPE